MSTLATIQADLVARLTAALAPAAGQGGKGGAAVVVTADGVPEYRWP